MASQSEDGFGPSAAFHMVCAQHDFVDIFHTKIRMIEARLAIEPWKGQVSVRKEDVVMLQRSVASGINSKPGLKVACSKVEAVAYGCERRLRVKDVEYNVIDDLGTGSGSPF